MSVLNPAAHSASMRTWQTLAPAVHINKAMRVSPVAPIQSRAGALGMLRPLGFMPSRAHVVSLSSRDSAFASSSMQTVQKKRVSLPSFSGRRGRGRGIMRGAVMLGHNAIPVKKGLYDPAFEKDACGVGFIADVTKTNKRKTVKDALDMLVRMSHRGACGCDKDSGDGAGILVAIPHDYFVAACAEDSLELPPAGEYSIGISIFLRKRRSTRPPRRRLRRRRCLLATPCLVGAPCPRTTLCSAPCPRDQNLP